MFLRKDKIQMIGFFSKGLTCVKFESSKRRRGLWETFLNLLFLKLVRILCKL